MKYNKTGIMTDHKRTVLVCDNDEKVLASIQSGLSEHNFNVQVMTSPNELVENAEQHHVDVVIVNPDLQGFNAYDTCKYLKKVYRYTHITYSKSTLQCPCCAGWL